MQKRKTEYWRRRIIMFGKKHPKLRYLCLTGIAGVVGISYLCDFLRKNAIRYLSVAFICMFFFMCSSFDYVNSSKNDMVDVTEYVDGGVISLQPSGGLWLREEENETESLKKELIGTFEESTQEATEWKQEDLEAFSMDDIISSLDDGVDYQNEETSSTETQSFHSDQWNLLLVNKQHPIPENYELRLGAVSASMQCDERVIPEMLQMMAAAKEDQVTLMICSPYRNADRQTMLFERKIRKYMSKGYSYLDSYQLSSQAVTLPGSSEHEIGLAFDIVTPSYVSLDENFENTEAGKWLAEHCTEYGFVLRYPKGKEYITGIEYEPWHFRYVGKPAAKIMSEQELCLEEFTDRYVD